MSSGEIKALRTEIESLRQLLESVRLNLTEVRDRAEVLETARGPSSRAGSARDREETASGYTVISQGSTSAEPVLASDKEHRAELAASIGRYLHRCINGNNHGPSSPLLSI